MRIISGTHKGRRILPPKNLPVRPTTDFAKEALFNILRGQVYFDEITVLDLFSGTGSISFEFASRGVPSITSVDSHNGCVQFINKVAEDLEMPIEAHRADVYKFLETTSQTFNIIFADPPYEIDHSEFETLVNTVFEKALLKEGGMLIVEHSKRMDLSMLQNFSESRKYSDSLFSFFRLQE